MKTVDTTIYKTISQIEAETTDVTCVRRHDYVRILALTEFLREVEKEHGENFRLTTAHPSLFEIRDKGLFSRTFGLGLWANFAIGNVHYSFSMNENIFFPVRFFKSWRLKEESWLQADNISCSEYADAGDAYAIIYTGWDGSASPEDIKRLTLNMHTALNEVTSRSTPTYRREIPSYDRKEKQTIYKGI